MHDMKRIAVVVFAMACAAFSAFGGSMSKSVPNGWTEDYKKACLDAKTGGKLVLLAFSGSDWCGWCVKMDRDIYSQKKFVSKAKHKFVLVMIDNPKNKSILSKLAKSQNRELCETFKVCGFPTSIVVRPDGTEVTRFVGYKGEGVQAFLKELDAVAEAEGAKTGSGPAGAGR